MYGCSEVEEEEGRHRICKCYCVMPCIFVALHIVGGWGGKRNQDFVGRQNEPCGVVGHVEGK